MTDSAFGHKVSTSAAAQQAQAHIQAGQIDKAEALLTALAARPDCDAEINHQLGLVRARQGRAKDALDQLMVARSKQPTSLEYTLACGRLLLSLGRRQEGLNILRGYLLLQHNQTTLLRIGDAMLEFGLSDDAAKTYQAAIEHDRNAAAYFRFAGALHALGRRHEAETAVREAIALNPSFAEAHNNLGILLLSRGVVSEAVHEFQVAISLNARYATAYNNLGTANKANGDLTNAEEAFRKAIAIKPHYAEAVTNLGALLEELNRKSEAVAIYRSTLARYPGDPTLLHSLANILAHAQESTDEAITIYKQLIALKPNTFDAYRQLGVTLCRQQLVAEAFEWFTAGAQATLAAREHKPSHLRVRHEQERRDNIKTFGQAAAPLGARVAGTSVNKSAAPIEKQWKQNSPQIVTIDSLLTTTALNGLREFCWQADIWHETFEEGYLGATPESGLACPLLAQVAEDLRSTYPVIFQDYPLVYLWAFKYGAGLRGTKIHADFAAVNVNFWITDDSANIDPNTGGLIVWDRPAPLDWNFEKYNRDEHAIRTFLASEKANKLAVPYRSNRSVIFDSDLFHETDTFSFQGGYRNRRINITLLFGHRK
jgi:tetratricopeptide (TPR) repeat protein